MTKKCFFGCKNKGKTLYFYGFPKDQSTRQKWLVALNPGQQQQQKNVCVCHRHFRPECFWNLGQHKAGLAQRPLLDDGSVPTILGPVDESGAPAKPAPTPTPPRPTPSSPSLVLQSQGQPGGGAIYGNPPGHYLSYMSPILIQGHSIQLAVPSLVPTSPPSPSLLLQSQGQPGGGAIYGNPPGHYLSYMSPILIQGHSIQSTSEQTLGGEGETHRDVGCQSDSYTVSSATQTARHVRTVGTTMLLPPPRSVSTQLSLDTLAPHVRSKGSQATASRQNVGTQTTVPGKGPEFPPVKSLDSALRSIAAKRRARLEELQSDEEPEDSVVSEPRDSAHLPGESLTRPSDMSGTDSTEDEEPQFIVFESCLTELLRTCPVCQRDCAVQRTGLGTHVAFTQLCPNCQFSRRKLLRL